MSGAATTRYYLVAVQPLREMVPAKAPVKKASKKPRRVKKKK